MWVEQLVIIAFFGNVVQNAIVESIVACNGASMCVATMPCNAHPPNCAAHFPFNQEMCGNWLFLRVILNSCNNTRQGAPTHNRCNTLAQVRRRNNPKATKSTGCKGHRINMMRDGCRSSGRRARMISRQLNRTVAEVSGSERDLAKNLTKHLMSTMTFLK